MRNSKITVLDGAFGTMLQSMGLEVGADPADWNIERPADVAAVHAAYAQAGADMVLSNTFGVNPLKYHGRYGIEELVSAALSCASSSGAKVALDMGPTGRLLKPMGDLDFDEALAAYSRVVKAAIASDNPPSAVFIETMGDTHELKAAVLAAKENCSLPVYATVSVDANGRLLTGGDIECVSVLLESLGVDAYGFNCSLGPDAMLPLVRRLAAVSTKPLIVKPNAGMPRIEDGRTYFDVGPEEFAESLRELAKCGASVLGGCCGTTPAHIRRLAAAGIEVPPREIPSKRTVVSSGTCSVVIAPGEALVIGERINPTGKKRLQEAYRRGDVAYVLREAVTQVDAGARILDINCGVPGLDEAKILPGTIQAVESVVNCPLQIDTSDIAALEAALRRVNGKALVNSVNGKRSSMDGVFPLVRRYGGVVVALCLDESGIPSTVQGRLDIAARILAEGAKYGLGPEDFVFDALTLAVSADPSAALVTVETVRRLTSEFGVNTVLGVSNVSFGLPRRIELNNAMYALSKEAGLSAAIANPSVIKPEIVPGAEEVLKGEDEGCLAWIESSQVSPASAAPQQTTVMPGATQGDARQMLSEAVSRGLLHDAAKAAESLLASGAEALDLIDSCIVPALEDIGRRFEAGTAYLPQLLMAADAAGAAFEVVRKALRVTGGERRSGPPVVLATVKGDIHDIGKNIVRALLDNYGFDVIDLGRDVPPERIVEAAIESGAMLVGLSALMTTTVGAMADTISLLKKSAFKGETVVGGAVVTQEYADSIGADHYSADAMRTVRIASKLRADFEARMKN